jgi:hypothetical protein
MNGEEYPIRLEGDYPPKSSRLLALLAILFGLKFLLLIPHIFLLYFVSLGAMIVALVGYFVVLITGRHPRGMWEFLLGFLRWQVRINA